MEPLIELWMTHNDSLYVNRNYVEIHDMNDAMMMAREIGNLHGGDVSYGAQLMGVLMFNDLLHDTLFRTYPLRRTDDGFIDWDSIGIDPDKYREWWHSVNIDELGYPELNTTDWASKALQTL